MASRTYKRDAAGRFAGSKVGGGGGGSGGGGRRAIAAARAKKGIAGAGRLALKAAKDPTVQAVALTAVGIAVNKQFGTGALSRTAEAGSAYKAAGFSNARGIGGGAATAIKAKRSINGVTKVTTMGRGTRLHK